MEKNPCIKTFFFLVFILYSGGKNQENLAVVIDL